MTISRVSSYSSYLSSLNGMNGTTSSLAELQQQFTSGIKSQSLADYGVDSDRLLNLKADYARRTGYSNAITSSTTLANATETALSSMETIVSNLMSSANIPAGAGTPTVSAVTSSNNGNLGMVVDTDNSVFTTPGTYTVSAVPSKTGKSGSYDVTVADGLGGVSTKTLNLSTVPPDDGQQTFQMSGGPGDGATVALNISTLKGTGSASFTVAYPDLSAPKALLQGALTQLSALLNTKAGDRYIFSGDRYSTAPAGDLSATKQVSKVTLKGTLGVANDTYEMYVGDKRYTYVTTGNETSMSDIMNGLASQINGPNQTLIAQGKPADPPIIASVTGNVLTLTGINAGYNFNVSSQVYTQPSYNNSVAGAATPADPGYSTYPSHTADDGAYAQYTSQLAVTADPTAVPPVTGQPQIDQVNLNGTSVDVGDVFTVTMGNRNTVTVTSDDANPANNVQYDTVDGPTTYSYVMNAADVAAAKADPNGPMNYVTQKLAGLVNADPAASAAATVTANPPGQATLTLTGNGSQRFATTAVVQNNSNQNTMTSVTLAPFQDPTSFSTTVTSPPYLAVYDSQYTSGAQSTSAYATSTVNVDDNLSATYGVSSNDPAIQTLVIGIKQMLSAVNNPGSYTAMMSTARSTIASAQDQLRQLDASTVNAQSILATAATNHTSAMTDTETQIGNIQNVDPTTVAAQLQALMNQQSGAYTVAGKLASLSLVNFLS
ncbi:MAG: hypothetical protein PW843_06275 [Azospirillaceae bacterium]|nr:hypothetical protein [Azospirillaceae bacterium]